MSAEHIPATELYPGRTIEASLHFRNGDMWEPALDQDGEPLTLTGLITNNLSDSSLSVLPAPGNKAVESDQHYSRAPILLPLDVFEREGMEYKILFNPTFHSDTSEDQP
ncbi:MAG TPA: hypothetical protein VFT87_01460 [Candidatus Saccharimonadales bacterium]|nr:hypothetical protein [Candidatus Saccharimonadales bacterium]